tara:strand:- start:7832 stop:8743 length:912 start_codon:yes stop_codon:yes gene_type:complete
MPIKCLIREELDDVKYNDCITKSKQSLLYGYTWYLDIVCDRWDVLVLDDYVAVMPVPWRRKYGIKYVYQPLWVLQLGIFSTQETTNELSFINELSTRFKFVEIRLNIKNSIERSTPKSVVNQLQYLTLENSYQNILKNFNRNRKRELKKAADSLLKEYWGDQPEKLLTLFEKNIGRRIKEITKEDYRRLTNLITIIISKGCGEVLSVYDNKEKIVASGFFLFHNKTVTELVCATDLENRNNGANTFLIDRAISNYQKDYDIFDFGGSSMKTIANYYKSFGANTYQYLFLKVNRLPALIRLFKP